MQLTLNIDKDVPGHYTARVCHGNELLGSTGHNTIAEAIANYGNDAPFGDVVAFDIWYGTVSVGTIGLHEMQIRAEELAADLCRRVAMVEEALRAL